MNKQQSDITTLNEIYLFFKYALPNIFGLLIYSSAGIVDAVFIGMYAGELNLAAVNIANPVFSFVWGISIMVTIGGAVAAGKYLGEKQINKACHIFTKSIVTIALLSALVIIIFYFFAEDIIKKIGGSDITTPLAAKYIETLIPFIFFNTIGYSLTVFARVDGFPFTASFAIITGAVTNVILDYIFIAVMGCGLTGAAVATGISFTVCFLIMVIHFLLRKGALKFIKIKNLKGIIKTSFNGFSEFLNEISIGFTMALFNIIIMKYAYEEGVAAFAAINYLMWIAGTIFYGTADALNPLISTNYGAGNFTRIKKFLKIGISFSSVNGILLFIIATLFDENLTGLFITNKDSNSFIMAVEFISFIKWGFLFSGTNMILSAYFTAMLRPKESSVIAVLDALILPSAMILTLPYILGKTGIYIAFPVSEFITLLFASTLFMLSRKFLLKR